MTAAIRLQIISTATIIASVGTIVGPLPSVFLQNSYEGNVLETTTQTTLLAVTSAVPYEFEPLTTSTIQTFEYVNQGSQVITISTVTFSTFGVEYFSEFEAPNNNFPITLNTGSVGTFTLYYSAQEEGIYFNEVTFVLDSADDYTFLTEQRAFFDFLLDYSPTSLVSTLTSVGGYIDSEFNFTGTGLPLNTFSATLSGSSTYTIIDSQYDSDSANVVVRFDSINFPVGTITTSTATLNIFANDEAVSIPLSTDVNFSSASNQAIATWSGPIAYDNAYIAMSYDIIDNVRNLTIAIGSGGNGSPEISDEGILFLDITDIGITGNNMITPFVNWLEVYRFPITSGQLSYLSKDYLTKSKNSDDLSESYGYYFGTGVGARSMFLVEHDGNYNLSVKINTLREYKGHTSFDRTLENLQNIFYYYSSNDRIFNLENFFDDDKTHYFIGFNNDGSIVTSVVVHP